MLKSTIDKICFKGFQFYVKRDDLLGEINGNKARKLAFYSSKTYAKHQRFISYGGIQSNAMAALSLFCFQRNIKFIFICKKIPFYLKENPCGNYALALKNKTEIIETDDNLKEYALYLCNKDDIFIEQGVANLNAEQGYKELASEIKEQSLELNLEFDIFLPSGTGTSAAFLAKHSQFKVFTCACVGDEDYLKKQILELMQDYDFKNLQILQKNQKYHFGKPYKEIYQLYKELKQECSIEFDLLYDMIGLSVVLKRKWEKSLLYIHQGGILGNASILQRYAFKGFK